MARGGDREREAGEEFGSLGVFTREREVFEILKGGEKPNQGMRVQ